MTHQQVTEVHQQRSEQVFRSQDGLVMLAHDTGGQFYQNNNDMLGQVEQAVRDSEGYYLIAYHPPSNTFDEKTGRFKFRNVKVRVKAAGLTVRSRAGFLNRADAPAEAPARTPGDQIRKALYSPFASGAIHLRLTPLFTNSAKDGSFVTGLLHCEAKDLTFTDQPDGWHKGVIDVVSVTIGDQGQVVDTTSKTFTMTLKADAYNTALKNGLFLRFRHPVKKPGFYTMRVAVRDEDSQRVGSANQFIEVPDVTRNLTLSSLMLEKETIAAKSSAADSTEGQVAQQDPKGNPVLRTFKQGDQMAYVYQIFNADAQPQPGALEVHTRIFRDGQQVYEGKPLPLQAINQQDPKHLVAAGAMRLGTHMTPGDYILQVIVTDKTGDKGRTATQSTDFEVEQ
jgi:hypothetical protein